VLYPGDERILGPYWSMPAQFLMFDALVEWRDDGELGGRLAKSWTHSPDYGEWTFTLRSDVAWHDGTPFTARDVAFTVALLQDPRVGWSPRGTTVEALDDTTVRVSDPNGKAAGLLDPYQVIYPEHRLRELEPDEFASWEFWTQPVGTGPFRYSRHVPQTMMAFEANPEYMLGSPAVDRVVLKFGEASITELMSGNVDVAGWATSADARQLAEDDRFEVYWEFGGVRAILWNQAHPFLSDARVRRALTHALDRRELIGVLGYPDELPILDALHSERQLRRGDLPAPVAFDPALAEALLDQSGWHDTDGDGVRDRGRDHARIELLVPREVAAAGVYVQDRLRRIGVDLEITTLETPMIRDRWRDGDFQAVIVFVNEYRLEAFFGEGDLLNYRSDAAAADVSAILEARGPEAREAALEQLAARLREDAPATFLFPSPAMFVVRKGVEGLSSPWRADPLYNLHRVRVSPGQR
jgi:peptide/nickel transport system substrate-binding protein